MVYEAYTGEKDDWGKEKFDDPITIKNVRFDGSTVFSRDQAETKILADGVIFVDARNSKNIPNEFKEQSKITLIDKNGNKLKDCTLKKVISCYYPTKNKIRHWELEVI